MFSSDPHRLNYLIVRPQCGLVTSPLLSCWYEASALPHAHNRLLSVIRTCLVWVNTISATSPVARLHHVSLADKKKENRKKKCLHEERREEGRRHSLPVCEAQRCLSERWQQAAALIISKLDEKRIFDTEQSYFKKLEFVCFFEGNTVHTEKPARLSCVKYLRGCEPVLGSALSSHF